MMNETDGGDDEEYCWQNEETGELFYGTPMELKREKGKRKMDIDYLCKIVDGEYPHCKSYKSWTSAEIPPPGSDKAMDLGGTCPVLDNGHGKGYMGTDDYVISFDCPLHGRG